MAASSFGRKEQPPKTKGRAHNQGVRIDSSLINTASSDVQNELSGLGVSVYNQDEFEAGVLQQIDQEVTKRNAEQQRKFLMKEYSSVKHEISAVRLELNNLSKSIAGLLSHRLCDVVSELRECRASQERKRKQLLSLEVREQQLLRKLIGKDSTGDNDRAGEGSTPDVAFGIALGDQSSEQQRLIQTGQITPFGGRVEEATLDEGTADSLRQMSDLTSVKAAELTPVEHPPMEPISSCSSNSQETDTLSSSSFQSDRTCSSQAVDPNMHSKDVNSTVEEEGKGRLRLSSDSFGGLFAEVKPVPSPATQKKKTSGGKSESSSKGKQRIKLAIAEASGMQGESMSVLGLQKKALEAGSESWESLSDGLAPDGGEWVPSEGEEEEESGESEYFTDEDLGGEGVGGVRRRKGRCGRKRKLRELSSDDESEDDLMSYRRRCKRRMASAVRLGKHQDDGDEELYRMRIRQHEEEEKEEESEEPDAVFEGGFRVPGSIWHRLYRYQQTGVKWLWELHCQQAGGIVGDEMGLGKTIQMIAFLAGLKESNIRSHVTRKLGLGPVLIVCPATVMHQWVSEFHTWWAPFRVAVLHDTGTFVGAKRILVDRIVAGDGVLIVTYAGMRGYRDVLLRYKWDYVILDEGHKIRNPDAEMTLTCKQFATPHRLILSGSPMQNNLRELWSLFDFVFPGKLGTLPVFMEQFSVPITLGGYANATEVQVQTAYRCACILRDTINPYLLRRLKADVKIQLPSKNEQVLFCRLTDYQRELYEDFIHGPEVQMMLSGRKLIFSGLMTLRKLCNHPDLVTNDFSELVRNEKVEGEEEEREFEILHVHGKKKKKKWALQSMCGGEDVESEEMYGHWRRSGKMVVVESLLKLWKAQDHRALLFTQTKQMLNILERFVASRGYSYQRMDGGTPISTRQPLINKFNEDRSIFLFILTTRVGGLGINLVGADRVLIYDPDWNPSTDTQARERAWRIGQTRQVTVYRLLTSGTIEEKIYHRQIFKQFLTNRVLKDPRQRRFFKSNDLSELFSLNSSSSEGSTETSAIFAGTGSEVVPNRTHVSREKSHDHSERISLAGSKRKPHSASKTSEPKKKKKKGNHAEILLVDSNKGSCDPPIGVVSEGPSDAENQKTQDSVRGQQPLNSSSLGMDCGQTSPVGMEPGPSSPDTPKHQKKHKHKRKKGGDSKRKRRKRRKNAEVEGAEITGVDQTERFELGDNDEGALNHKQDDFILRKLFKKSGVHTALQHDTIMSSGDPDYVLVETEAKKVAQSAARAMRQSRQHCMVAGRWGRPTWTGQHGVIGVPPPRFGSKSLTTSTQGGTSNHFDGKSTSSVSRAQGSLNTSSSVLLVKMKKRNTHELPGRSGSGIHQDTHRELLAEMRDFIATQCKVDGQATTDEILSRFSCRLPPSSTAVFRSLLREICDFSRYHGDGMWTLKPEFR